MSVQFSGHHDALADSISNLHRATDKHSSLQLARPRRHAVPAAPYTPARLNKYPLGAVSLYDPADHVIAAARAGERSYSASGNLEEEARRVLGEYAAPRANGRAVSLYRPVGSSAPSSNVVRMRDQIAVRPPPARVPAERLGSCSPFPSLWTAPFCAVLV